MPFMMTAWNNGKHHETGVGYGLKVRVEDRENYFNREWTTVILELPVNGGFVEVTVNVGKPAFWNDTCHELISQQIGQWLRNSKLAPWPFHHPPRFLADTIGEGRFRILEQLQRESNQTI
jgi:hypothetical protein